MDILIHSEGFTLDDNSREMIVEKVSRMEHYFPRAMRARVTVRMDSPHPGDSQFIGKMLLEVPGHDMAAEQKAAAPMEAVDLLCEKVERQIRKRKTEKLSKRTKGSLKEAQAAT